jgi:hypothetical protein
MSATACRYLARYGAHPSVNSVLLRFVYPFRLDQQESMIEQESHQVRNLLTTSPTSLQWTFVDQFTLLIPQPQVLSISFISTRQAMTHNRLVRPKDQLLLQLRKLEDVFRLSTLNINLGQESLDHLDNLGDIRLILTIIRCIFQYSLQKQWVSTKSSSRFSKITVQLQFS